MIPDNLFGQVSALFIPEILGKEEEHPSPCPKPSCSQVLIWVAPVQLQFKTQYTIRPRTLSQRPAPRRYSKHVGKNASPP